MSATLLQVAAHGSEPTSIASPEAKLDAPFEQLATALAKTGRVEAASITRQWIPPARSDASVLYFSQIGFDITSPSLSEPKVKAAFLDARKSAASAAKELAVAAAKSGQAERAYHLLWRALREDPANDETRRLLGLASGNTSRASIRPGRDAPAVLGWPPRSFLQAQTRHFRIYSTASRRETEAIAEDLERYFEVWTQIFWPLWTDEPTLISAISSGQPIHPPQHVAEVVLFGDEASYQRAVAGSGDAASVSTGFYSPDQKLTLLFAGKGADTATRYHELTHQLLQEFTGQVVDQPGNNEGFWIVEGVANYMESTRFLKSYAAVGGWESPRLQYARARWLMAPPEELDAIWQLGIEQVQQRTDLAEWYTLAAAYVHLLLDSPSYRRATLRYLQSVYRGNPDQSILAETASEQWSQLLVSHLRMEHIDGAPHFADDPLRLLCVGRTDLEQDDITALAPLEMLTWCDVGNLALTDEHVERLWGNGTSLTSVNLENNSITDALAPTLQRHRALQDLDLSFTPFTDEGLEQLRDLPHLEMLLLTGSQVTDKSIPTLLNMRSLRTLDLQRTQITNDGLERLRRARPELELNPLQLIENK